MADVSLCENAQNLEIKLIKQQILLLKKLHSLKRFVRTTVATSHN